MKKIKKIEDITILNDREVQLILREIEMDNLAGALKGVSPELIEKIYSNMSENAVNETTKKIQELGPVKLDKVELLHDKIVKMANRVLEKNK